MSIRSRVKNVFNLRSLWVDMLPRGELRDAYRLLWKIREVKINSSPTVQGDRKAASMRTVIAASAIGTTIEWYDFLIYATAASLVLNKLFFPTEDPLVGKLISISTIGVGFFARPIGAIALSHFGDRLGRKSMLILTLVSMGVATTLIGVLSMFASIGIAAPRMLGACRWFRGLLSEGSGAARC